MEYLLADSQPPHLFILRKMYRHAAAPVSKRNTLCAFVLGVCGQKALVSCWSQEAALGGAC